MYLIQGMYTNCGYPLSDNLFITECFSSFLKTETL